MKTPPTIRILVVDDHTLFRRGLISLLAGDPRFAVVAEAGDASEAQRRAQQTQPDLILLDNHLPGVNGVDALADLHEAAPQARILMLTVSEDQHDLAAALRAGAHGYLLKTVDSDGLAQALLRTMAGEAVVSPQMTSKLVSAFQALPINSAPTSHAAGAATTVASTSWRVGASPSSPLSCALSSSLSTSGAAQLALDTLSPREREILRHIAQGASNKGIARALAIAETTVKIHVQHILRKLQLSSRVQAAVLATSSAQQLLEDA